MAIAPFGKQPATTGLPPVAAVRHSIVRAIRRCLYYPAFAAVVCVDVVERAVAWGGGDLYRLLLVPG